MDKVGEDRVTYERRRAYRQGLLEGMWKVQRLLMKEISKLEIELDEDYPETRGEDPGY